MIYNYLKIAYRNLLKYKFISFINIFGLTIGFTCCLLILIFILNELSFDRYNSKAERTYRVTRSFKSGDGKQFLHLGTVAPPFGPLIKNDFPDIQYLSRFLKTNTLNLKYKDKIFNEDNVYFADENMFSVFDISVTKGDPSRALNNPFSIMLSEPLAKKYFGEEDPLDKIISQNQRSYKVTGVYKPFPSNAHLHPEILLSFNTLRDSTIYGERNLQTNWGNNSFFTYLVLPPNYPADKIEAQFPAFIDRHMPKSTNATNKPSQFTNLYLQKLTDIHLRSHLDYEAEENGDISRVYIFSAIALFILLIACINYMNLSTARSVLRAREIGVRKVVGAERKEIIFQFLSESVLLTTLSLALSFLLTWLLIPWLNDISGQQLNIKSVFSWQMIVGLVTVPFVIGILSGIYPALFMSSFKPAVVLKGLFKANTSKYSFRQVLVVVQFAISIILIICTIVVFQQLRFIQNTSLGYDRDHVVTFRNAMDNTQYDAFRNQLLQHSSIKSIGRSSRIPTGRLLDASGASIAVADTLQPIKADIKFVTIDYDFIPTYGIQMAGGRNFSREYGTDTASFIINEATLGVLNLKSVSEAIGKSFGYGSVRGKIVGVTKDFHFESMHQKIIPMIFLLPSRNLGNYNRISVKIAGNNMKETLSSIEKTWQKTLPEIPFEYNFLDESFKRLYQAESRQGTLFTTFSVIAIFIACLGLFGLSAFTITQRIKEIGIRKVLGASTGSIVSLLSKDFIKLVIISAVIAFPVAWYAMNQWLQDFAYRTNIQWWIFIGALILAGLVALVTISIQAIKAALSNPVKSLRSE